LYKRPEPDVDHSPPSSAKVGTVKNYGLPPAMFLPSWRVMSLNLFIVKAIYACLVDVHA